MQALTVPARVSSADRLGVTIFFSILAHLIVILGVTFSPEDLPPHRVETLDVVLVPLPSETAPDQSDYLAQVNREVSGDNAEKVRPATPLASPVESSEPAVAAVEPAVVPVEPVPAVVPVEPVPAVVPVEPAPAVAADDATAAPRPGIEPSRSPAPASSDGTATAAISPGAPFAEPNPVEPNLAEAAPAEAVPAEADARVPAPAEAVLIAAEQPLARLHRVQEPAGPPAAVEPARVEEEPVEKTPGGDGSAQASFPAPARDAEAEARTRRALAMAALKAEIERDLRAYAERPRRKWISASTREHRFAAYMDAWRRKVEEVGNLNYPEEAERRGLTGDLLLDVAIRPDGTVEEITLRRSSGERVLDEAAVRIVEIAAPFGAFPEDIAEDVDILHIERTWIFHSGGATMSR